MTLSNAEMRIRMIRALDEHRAMITAYAYAILRDHHLADDVYQDVAVIVASEPERMPHTPNEVGAWMRAIARRKALEHGRKARRHPISLDATVLEQIGEAYAEEATASSGFTDLKESMSQCLQQLDGDAHRVIHQRYGNSSSCEAIAASINRTVQSVYAILKRVRLQLADCVEKNMRKANV